MILVSGSLAFDYILNFHGKFADNIVRGREHLLNLSFYAPEMRRGFGGTAGNIAYGLALLNMPVAILGMVGSDFLPYKKFLKSHGVKISHLKISSKHHTSTAFGITDLADNQIWGFHPGADAKSDNLSVKRVNEKIKFGIVAPNNPKAMLKFSREYNSLEIPFMFDPGMQLPKFSSGELKHAMKGASIIIGNDYETGLMEKKLKIGNIGVLSKRKQVIVSTLGAKGSLVFSGGKKIFVKAAKPKKVLDPSGAGDAYRAGFVCGYVSGKPVEVCAQMGSAVAAYAVENLGTSTYYFSKVEFLRRLKSNY